MKREMDKVYKELEKIFAGRNFSVSVARRTWEDSYRYNIYIADSGVNANDFIIRESGISFNDALRKVNEAVKLHKGE